MAMQVVVGDRSGYLLCELEVEVGSVGWVLNEVGSAKLRIARGAAKATEENLRYGNRLCMRWDNGLPNWVGVVDPPRDWQAGLITVTGYSAEYLLGMRMTDRGRYFTDAAVGEIYERLVSEANDVSSLGISLGSIFKGGIGHYPDYHIKNLLGIVRESLCGSLSTYEFDVTGDVVGGRIVMSANFYERKGTVKPAVALVEDKNLGTVRLIEQGTIVNQWNLAGAGSGWGADERPYSTAEDATSMSLYGLRQDGQVFSDVSVQATLDEHATTLLANSKYPHNMLELEALDKAPGAFADYGVGDSVQVLLTSFGFGGYDHMVRVRGREYNIATGTCKLAVREDE